MFFALNSNNITLFSSLLLLVPLLIATATTAKITRGEEHSILNSNNDEEEKILNAYYDRNLQYRKTRYGYPRGGGVGGYGSGYYGYDRGGAGRGGRDYDGGQRNSRGNQKNVIGGPSVIRSPHSAPAPLPSPSHHIHHHDDAHPPPRSSSASVHHHNNDNDKNDNDNYIDDVCPKCQDLLPQNHFAQSLLHYNYGGYHTTYIHHLVAFSSYIYKSGKCCALLNTVKSATDELCRHYNYIIKDNNNHYERRKQRRRRRRVLMNEATVVNVNVDGHVGEEDLITGSDHTDINNNNNNDSDNDDDEGLEGDLSVLTHEQASILPLGDFLHANLMVDGVDGKEETEDIGEFANDGSDNGNVGGGDGLATELVRLIDLLDLSVDEMNLIGNDDKVLDGGTAEEHSSQTNHGQGINYLDELFLSKCYYYHGNRRTCLLLLFITKTLDACLCHYHNELYCTIEHHCTQTLQFLTKYNSARIEASLPNRRHVGGGVGAAAGFEHKVLGGKGVGPCSECIQSRYPCSGYCNFVQDYEKQCDIYDALHYVFGDHA